MSNANVGVVYEHVIQEVINAVRVDFEEGGVPDEVLEELKKAWQQKLSRLNVATFPWDPKPEPPAAPTPAAPAPVAAPAHIPHPPQQQQQPAAASYTQSTLTPQAANHPAAAQYSNGNGVSIKPDNDPVKQEPGMGGMPAPTMAYSNSGPPHSGGMAAQRAAQQLDNRYGPRAAASIDALRAGQAQPMQQNPRPGQPQPMQQMQMNQQQMAQHQMSQQQYRQGVAASMQQRMPQQPPSNLPNAQHDGAADGFEGVLLRRGPDGRPVEMGRVEIDQVIHAQMAARAREMEGGGLMVPLRRVERQAGTASKKATSDGPSQVDGPDDDDDDEREELDEDAINSDLDDPVREDEDDEDDFSGQMMLCMYDKVQRVKNKWKCTLKDGVLTVSGREYVFQKATGEYEW